MSEISHLPTAPTQTEGKAPGAVVERHRHDEHQLIYVSAGVIAIATSHGSWVASRDRALWVPAQVWHEHRFHGHSLFHTVGFPVTASVPLPIDSPVVVSVDPLLRELLIAYTDGSAPGPESDRVFGVILDRLVHASVQPVSLPTPDDTRLASACRLVEADLSVPLTLASVARTVGASERTLSRLFQAEFGMTYPQWRTRRRVLQAMVLLAGGLSVTQTAHRCGWASTSAFVDTFVRTMGTTPGRYRAAAGSADTAAMIHR